MIDAKVLSNIKLHKYRIIYRHVQTKGKPEQAHKGRKVK